MALSKVDKAIAVINYESKFFRNEIQEVSQRTQVTEGTRIRVQRMDNLLRNVDVLVREAKSNVEAILGKIPAQATELEETLLGALLLQNWSNPEAIMNESPGIESVPDFLKPEHFYKESHQEIYKSILRLKESGSPIDMKTVTHQLRVDGTIELVGGAYYIAELASKMASAANVAHYARIIIEMAIKRQLALIAQSLMMDAYDDQSDCFVMLDKADTQIKQAQGWIKQ